MTFALTQHAVVRTQQRGVPHHLIDTLMSFTEFEAPVGGGCTILRMTRDRLDDLDLADRLNSERVRRAGRAASGVNGPAKTSPSCGCAGCRLVAVTVAVANR